MGWQSLRRRSGQCVDLISIETNELKPTSPFNAVGQWFTVVFDPRDMCKENEILLPCVCQKKAGAQRTVRGKHQRQQWISFSKTIVGFRSPAYEETGLVWKQGEWRELDPEE